MARKPDFAAVSRTHDMHRLSLLIRSFARAIFCNVALRKVLAWVTEIKTHINECQRIKTANWSWKEQQDTFLHFYKKKNAVGEKAKSTILKIFPLKFHIGYSCEKT